MAPSATAPTVVDSVIGKDPQMRKSTDHELLRGPDYVVPVAVPPVRLDGERLELLGWDLLADRVPTPFRSQSLQSDA